jgi:adenine deaminase
MDTFIRNMPKAEFHLHISGTLEADYKLELAKRHGITLPSSTLQEIEDSYNYSDLESFLKGLSEGNSLLRTEQDMYELTYRFLKKTATENHVIFSNLMFNPQEHIIHGISLAQQFNGMRRAQAEAEALFGIRSQVILSFIRPIKAELSYRLLEEALEFRDYFSGVGFDYTEQGNPPVKFRKIIERAKAEGLQTTCHCDLDQENSVEHIRQCIEDLELDRIDHGVNVLDCDELLDLAAERGVHFTICPISTVDGQTTPDPRRKNPRYHLEIPRLIDRGINFSLNTDDPSYFMGYYMNDILLSTQKAVGLSKLQLVEIMSNTFDAAWVSQQDKDHYKSCLKTYYQENSE